MILLETRILIVGVGEGGSLGTNILYTAGIWVRTCTLCGCVVTVPTGARSVVIGQLIRGLFSYGTVGCCLSCHGSVEILTGMLDTGSVVKGQFNMQLFSKVGRPLLWSAGPLPSRLTK
jgi:hypothetical protein